MSKGTTAVTLIPGDGIGPEVAESARRIVDATGVKIDWEVHEAGAEVFKKGLATGVPQDTIASIERTRCALKGPLETPVGFGEKSANVTLRKLFETYANVRPVRETPGVPTPYSGRGLDLVVVRENVEDLYAGIEHMQTPDVAQTLKLISRKGCEKVIRLAFALAEAEGRTNVACATKANIMKMTEGTMKRTFEEIAPEHPDIDAWHVIVDNCAHQLVKKPEQFEMIVTTNMNGDILSDLTSALVGGLGFAPSANLGTDVAIFEAVHGSAPKYAGKDVINPTAMILSAVLMLRHIGELEAASSVENAVMATLASGVRTRDVIGDDGSVGTTAYTEAVIGNLGKSVPEWTAREVKRLAMPVPREETAFVIPESVELVGVDVFFQTEEPPATVGEAAQRIAEGTALELKMVECRGTQVWPKTSARLDPTDVMRARFITRGSVITSEDILELLGRFGGRFNWVHVEKLRMFDGEPSFSRAQGEI
ncbi:MAG: NADP-dependent isocitrate dehydrogenase [Actinobacteria bacterium]|nr:NADP-dependent isocitrate dehydrogenase [Actinomycetota bacterium]